MSAVETALLFAAVVLLGIGVPSAVMAMLVPSLTSSETARSVNFAGRSVAYGLGIVWLVWAGCAVVGGLVANMLGASTALGILVLAGPLALVAFAMGLVDDAYGTSAAKGFKGHVKAMLTGRLTTGGLKLLGVGIASLFVATIIADIAPWGRAPAENSLTLRVIGVLLAGAAIALTANLLNLLDLRPGRALKIYSVLAVFGAIVCSVGVRAAGSGDMGAGPLVVAIAALGLFVLGPVVAIWRYDLGEIGMLGDAGANPMGAVAGLFVVSGLPLWALAGYLIVVTALNLISERVSFSRVIDATPALRRLDRLGRRSEPVDIENVSNSSTHSGADHE